MKIESVQIVGPIKIFADNQDVVILGEINQPQQEKKNSKIICNLVSQKKFNKQENNEKKVIGNPAIDIAKGSFIKFGPNSQFLLKEKKRKINIHVNKDYYDIVEPYLNIMNVNEIILSSSILQCAEFKSEQIKNIIFSRVPLQLCTIENSNLIPLNDGFRQPSQTQTITSVDQKVKLLHLGFLEEHLSNYNNKIFVVGIIGKQSSGKSYLLNRVFGTRFSVSSARCTDGVWGSIAYVEDQTFLVLDCEGLFNGARTDKEEIKMLAFLTAICDITILNSDLTFNRHYNDLFNHLVEASKQLNDEKLFKGILYFVLRDVSSTDNTGAEKELIKNLERLKESGSEEIIFLKRLFNNKLAVEKLINYENTLFDKQLFAVRKYFLENSAKSNRWKNGIQLIQMMKILLCQLELSDNTNASLIELQIRIENIFEKSKELWYEFTSNEVQSQNAKLIQEKYNFINCKDHQYILFNKDLMKQLYEDLEIEDSIQTHNKNLQQAKSQFNQMMEYRKEYIISRTQQETSRKANQITFFKHPNQINNFDFLIFILYEKQVYRQSRSLNNDLKQHVNFAKFLNRLNEIYEFCLEKCNQCHLLCKQFKNHIEISYQLKKNLEDQIKSLENQQRNSQIKSQDQEKEKRERFAQIEKECQDAENQLEVFELHNQINIIRTKQNQEKTAMKNYNFYNESEQCINLSFFQIGQFKKEQSQNEPLDYLVEFQDKIKNSIQEFQIKKENDTDNLEQLIIIKQSSKVYCMEIIKQQKDQLITYDIDYRNKEQSISQIKINQENQQQQIIQINQYHFEKNTNLQIIQSQIDEIGIPDNENDIKVLQSEIEQETLRHHSISNQVEEDQKLEKEKALELQTLLQTDLNLYFDRLNKEVQEFVQQSNELEEEIENLEGEIRCQKELREKIKKEQTKKVGSDKKKIEELTQKLNGRNEQEINTQLNQCQLRKEKLEKNLENLDSFQLFKQCQEELEIVQQNIQIEIGEQEIGQQENIIQVDFQNLKIQTQKAEKFEDSKNQTLINLFLRKKEEQLIEIKNSINSNLKEIQEIKNTINQIEQKIIKITQKNNLLDTIHFFNVQYKLVVFEYTVLYKQFENTQKRLNFEICDIQNIQQELENKLQKTNQELLTYEQNLEEIRKNKEQLIEDNKHLEKKNNELYEQKTKLMEYLDQINTFIKHFNEYKVQGETLKEKSTQLKILDKFEQFKDQEYVLAEIERLKKIINDCQEEKEQVKIQLKTFNQFAIDAENLKNLKDTQKKLVDQELNVFSTQKVKIIIIHSCKRESHKCDQVCQACPDKICNNKAGHDEQQEHLCNKQDHRCNKQCQIINCSNPCMKGFKHDPKIHNCLNDHPCLEKCQYCDKKCKRDRSDPHYTTHDCQDNSCTYKCKLCQRRCCEPHKHSLEKEKDNHFCENVHYCQELCEEDGICKIEYEISQAIWKTKLSEFQYIKYVQKNNRKQICQKQIPVRCNQHDGSHQCKDETQKQFHHCDQQCPECNTYCDLKQGHGGPHSSDRHRNKENQIFTIQEGNQVRLEIKVQKETTIRKYQIGDSSAPETCDQSCKRRGRAHFHLVQCQGGKQCLAQKGEYKARHSKEKYVNFENLNFDEVLCEDFWKQKNWIHPIQNELDNIIKCNYQCPLCQEQNKDSFCNQSAWHTQDDKIRAHSFSCIEIHKQNQFQGINIAFVIDTTGSMKSHIDMCKVTIKDIMKQAKSYHNLVGEKFDITFAVISYKDHKKKYDNKQKIIDEQNFTSEQVIIQFLDDLKVEGGDDDPEAVLDGLNASINLKWIPKYEKLLYLIADAPPHGKQYHNFQDNYPEGCPCGLKQDIVLNNLLNMNVGLRILKLNQCIEIMIQEFTKDFKDLIVLDVDKKNEHNHLFQIVNDVCKCIKHIEITYQMER